MVNYKELLRERDQSMIYPLKQIIKEISDSFRVKGLKLPRYLDFYARIEYEISIFMISNKRDPTTKLQNAIMETTYRIFEFMCLGRRTVQHKDLSIGDRAWLYFILMEIFFSTPEVIAREVRPVDILINMLLKEQLVHHREENVHEIFIDMSEYDITDLDNVIQDKTDFYFFLCYSTRVEVNPLVKRWQGKKRIPKELKDQKLERKLLVVYKDPERSLKKDQCTCKCTCNNH